MKIVPLDAFVLNERGSSLCLGFFDGVHRGHQKIILDTVHDAETHGRASVLFTFPFHPLSVIAPDHTPPQLTTFEERKCLMQECNLDYLVWRDFDRAFSETPPESFVEHVLVKKLAVRSLFIGPNYRFGWKASGTPEMLINLGGKRGFTVHIISPVFIDEEMISSTVIRNMITSGNVAGAGKMLGRPYGVSGKALPDPIHYPEGTLSQARIADNRVIPDKGAFAGFVISGEHRSRAIIYINAGAEKTGASVSFFLPESTPRPLRSDISLLFIERIRGDDFQAGQDQGLPLSVDMRFLEQAVKKQESMSITSTCAPCSSPPGYY